MLERAKDTVHIQLSRMRGPVLLKVSPFEGLKSETIMIRALRRSIQAVGADKLDLIAGEKPTSASLYARSARNNGSSAIGFNLIARGEVSLNDNETLRFEGPRRDLSRIPDRQLVIVPDSYLSHYKEEFTAVLSAKQIAEDGVKLMQRAIRQHPKSPYSLACKTFENELKEKKLDCALPNNSEVVVLKLNDDRQPTIVCFGKIDKSTPDKVKFTWERWTQQPGEKNAAKALRDDKMHGLIMLPVAYVKHELRDFLERAQALT